MAFLNLERLDENIRKQELIKEEAKKVASETSIPARVVHNEMRRENRVPQYINFDLHDGDIFEDAYDQAMSDALEIEKEEEEKKRNKVNKTINKVKSSLNDSVPNTVANQMTSKTYKPFPIGAAALPADMYETVDMTPEEVQQTYYKAPKKTIKQNIKEVGANRENKLIDKVENTMMKKEGKQSRKEIRQEAKMIKEQRKQLNIKEDPIYNPKVLETIAVRKINKAANKQTKSKKQQKQEEQEQAKLIIDKVPDKYDAKRRKIEKKKSDANMRKELEDIRQLEAKQEAKDEYRKLKAEVSKQKRVEQLAQGGGSSSSSNVFGIRGIEATPLPIPDLKPPSLMNLQHLRDILQHKSNNKKLSKQALIDYEKAKTDLLKNKSDSKIKLQTLSEFRRIYKEEVYKK